MITLNEGIALRSGVMFDYNNPRAAVVPIRDIAFALGNVCRFSGHIPFYSVAQHSVNVSRLVPPELAFTALLHDTSEAFTNDVPTPLKTAIPAFKALELRIEEAMSEQFGFQFPLPPEVKFADLQMLLVEKTYLKKDDGDWAILRGIPFPDLSLIDIAPMGPNQAAQNFLLRYEELKAA